MEVRSIVVLIASVAQVTVVILLGGANLLKSIQDFYVMAAYKIF